MDLGPLWPILVGMHFAATAPDPCPTIFLVTFRDWVGWPSYRSAIETPAIVELHPKLFTHPASNPLAGLFVVLVKSIGLLFQNHASG
jgi:hypothetical protein